MYVEKCKFVHLLLTHLVTWAWTVQKNWHTHTNTIVYARIYTPRYYPEELVLCDCRQNALAPRIILVGLATVLLQFDDNFNGKKLLHPTKASDNIKHSFNKQMQNKLEFFEIRITLNDFNSVTHTYNWCSFWLTKAIGWWLLKIVTSNFSFSIKLWRLSTGYNINSLFFFLNSAFNSVNSTKFSIMLTKHCLDTVFWYDPFALRGLVWMKKNSVISQLSLISWNHVSVRL